MLPSDASFSANSAERWLRPDAGRSWAEPSRYLAPLATVLIYALLFFLLVLENRFEPVAPTAPVEIPIEIMPEPPPPPPAPAPQPTEQPLDEKPAYDAPRPANDEKVEREAPDTETKAPPAPPTDKPPGQDAETGKTKGTEAEVETPAKESPADPAKEKTVAEPSPTGDVRQQAPQQTRAEAEVPPQTSAPSAGVRLPTFNTVPDVDFSGAAKAAPIAGGNAKATYLSIIYGMIMARVHRPTSPHLKSARSEGTVSFTIDGRGYLTQRWTTQPSGSPELDAAIFEAIGAASPFPPPPRGRPAGLKFMYHSD